MTAGRAFGDGRVPEIERLNELTLDSIVEATGVTGPVLDVGANYGYLLHYAQERYGMAGLGVDPHPQRVDGIRTVVLQGTGEQLWHTAGHHPGTFGLVVFSHSLEHHENYRAALRGAWDLLRPGGVLFVAVPHPKSIDWLHEDGSHVVLFTKGLLEQALHQLAPEPSRLVCASPTLRPHRRELWAAAVHP